MSDNIDDTDFHGPPFTVPRYGSLAASIIAERDRLRAEVERLQAANASLRAALERYRGQVDQYGVHSAADALAGPAP